MDAYLILPLGSLLAFVLSAVLLRRAGIPDGRFILVACLLFGCLLGMASVFLWPGDLGVYLNIPGTAFGDWMYRFAIEKSGNPHSDQAHYTIPWILRVPQVYSVATLILCVSIGLPVQFLYNRIRGRRGKPA